MVSSAGAISVSVDITGMVSLSVVLGRAVTGKLGHENRVVISFYDLFS